MGSNNTTVVPRGITYDAPEVQVLLDKVNDPDTEPTEDSEELITSGGVKAALDAAADGSLQYEENNDPMSLLEEEEDESDAEE